MTPRARATHTDICELWDLLPPEARPWNSLPTVPIAQDHFLLLAAIEWVLTVHGWSLVMDEGDYTYCDLLGEVELARGSTLWLATVRAVQALRFPVGAAGES